MSQKPGSRGRTGIGRRGFIKAATAGTFVAPTLVSFAADHMLSQAYAQQSYVPQLVNLQAVGTEAGGITLVNATFSLPMRTSAVCGQVADWDGVGCTGSVTSTSHLSQSVDWTTRWSAGNTVLLLRLAPGTPVDYGRITFNDPTGCAAGGAPLPMQSEAGVELPASGGCFFYQGGFVPRMASPLAGDNR